MSDEIDLFISKTIAATKNIGRCTTETEVDDKDEVEVIQPNSECINCDKFAERLGLLEVKVELLQQLISSREPIQLNISNNNESTNQAKTLSQNTNNNELLNDISIADLESQLNEVYDLILNEKDQNLIDIFDSLKMELKGNEPKKATINCLWEVLTKAVPAVKDALEIGKYIATLT